MEITANIHETNGRSVTEALPDSIRNPMEETCRDLIATRVKYGANTAIGHRCSNIDVMLRKGAPVDMIQRQMAELQELLAAR